MSDEPAELAVVLRELRTRTGKSLKELERLTAASDSALSRYFSGSACPPWSVVERLCQAADEDPARLRGAWEQARRAKLGRYRPRVAEAAEAAEAAEVAEVAEQSEAPPSTVTTEPARRASWPRTSWPRVSWLRLSWLRLSWLRVLRPRARWRRSAWTASVAATLVLLSGSALAARLWSSETPGTQHLCPWRYVVTDGDPAPVRIADRPGANRQHLPKTYAPEEVFYALDPPEVVNAMLHTVDGWVTQGDWIVRHDGPCVVRSLDGEQPN